MEVALLFAGIITLLLMGVPIAVALGLSSISFLLIGSDSSLASIAQTFYEAMAGHYTLLAIPFFILASSFMSTGGVAKRIMRVCLPVCCLQPCLAHLQPQWLPLEQSLSRECAKLVTPKNLQLV
jgi:TRAP-type mannitol/chloroaromatic compound transport system permease large subunit